jgi:hypothetical protein
MNAARETLPVRRCREALAPPPALDSAAVRGRRRKTRIAGSRCIGEIAIPGEQQLMEYGVSQQSRYNGYVPRLPRPKWPSPPKAETQ